MGLGILRYKLDLQCLEEEEFNDMDNIDLDDYI